MPSLACAAATALRRPAAPAAAAAPGTPHGRRPGLRAPGAARPAPAGERAERTAPLRVNARAAVYLLNPSGDLPATQAAFEPWFRRQPGWQARRGPERMPRPCACAHVGTLMLTRSRRSMLACVPASAMRRGEV